MCVSFQFFQKSLQVPDLGAKPFPELPRHVGHRPREGKNTEHQEQEHLRQSSQHHHPREIDEHIERVISENRRGDHLAHHALGGGLLLVLTHPTALVKWIAPPPSLSRQLAGRKLGKSQKDRFAECPHTLAGDPSVYRPHPQSSGLDLDPLGHGRVILQRDTVLVEALPVGESHVSQDPRPLEPFVSVVLVSAPVVEVIHTVGLRHLLDRLLVLLFRGNNTGIAPPPEDTEGRAHHLDGDPRGESGRSVENDGVYRLARLLYVEKLTPDVYCADQRHRRKPDVSGHKDLDLIPDFTHTPLPSRYSFTPSMTLFPARSAASLSSISFVTRLT